ncbi:MAG: hypothetical protein MZU91_03215 [Desulfosudis oleivorans]|nr:hypothetical protein [Desulfosudis oleivorans]
MKSPAQELCGIFFGLLLVYDLFEVLHQSDDVAMPEDARCEALRPELLKLVQGLAHAEELHRLAW